MLLLAAAAALTFHAPIDDGRARLAPHGLLRFDASRIVDLQQGTVSFWWKPVPGAAFAITHAGRLDRFLFLTPQAGHFALIVRDRDLTDSRLIAEDVAPAPDRWRHIAITWAELSGVALYIDSRRRAAVPGPLYFNARPGALEFRGGEADELRIYSGALAQSAVAQLARRENPAPLPPLSPPPPLAGRLGWHAAANIASGSQFRVKKIAIKDARAINRLSWLLADGREATSWPSPEPEGRYRDEAADFTFTLDTEPINTVRTTGNARASIEIEPGFNSPRAGGPHHLHYFRFRPPRSFEEAQIKVETGTLSEVSFLRIEPLPAGHQPEHPIARLPAAQDTALRGVYLEFPTRVSTYYRLAVPDPSDASSNLIEFDFRANAAKAAAVELKFPTLLLPANRPMSVEILSSDEANQRVTPSQLIWLGAPEALRRQLAPAQSWTEPAPPPNVPRWAWQQVAIIRHLRKIADWWIDFRQIDSGEFGLGPKGDAALLQLWPDVAALDGKVERYRQSARRLYDWLVKERWADPREVGLIALALHPGNPRLVRSITAPPPIPPISSVGNSFEDRQSELWRSLERDGGKHYTESEPAAVAIDTSAVTAARLGVDRAISWENTGGELAARVTESSPQQVKVQLFSLSKFARRVKMRVWRLEHADYELTRSEGTGVRFTLKPGSPLEIDLPSQRLVSLELKQIARHTPVDQLSDLAIASEEISRGPGGDLLVPVFNLGNVPTPGPATVTVTVFAPDSSQVLAEVHLEAPIPPHGQTQVRFPGIDRKPGLRFQVRQDAAERFDANNEAALISASPR